MNIKEPARVLDEISEAQVPQDLNLMSGILAKVQPEKHAALKNAARLAGLLLFLVLVIRFFSLPGVASALKRLIGYIPGVGVVDQSAALRVLANPVTGTRDGYTITVESAVLDAARTVINFRISGPFPTWDDPSRMPLMCNRPPILRLPDGRELVYPRGEGSSGNGEVRWQEIFPAIPASDDHALLVLPCLSDLPAQSGPQNWEIPLAFEPAPPEMTVFPVVEPATATPAQPEASSPANGAKLSLQGYAALNDGYYLQTTLHWEKIPGASEVQVLPDAVHLFDAAGQEVPVWPADQALLAAPAENRSMALNLQTGPITSPGPARLVVDYVGVSMPAEARFTLDVGDAPQPGQKWELNRNLDIGGHSLRVVSAEYIQAEPGQPAWLMLYLSSDTGILTVTAMDREHEILGTGGSPGSAQVPFRAGWGYKDAFPHGQITVTITTITVKRPGPWSMTWTPPADVTPTAEAAASELADQQQAALQPAAGKPGGKGVCVDETAFQAAPGELPAGLAGRAVFSKDTYEMTVSDIDGSSAIPAGSGVFPDISRDGKWVVYRSLEGGLYVRDVAGGGDTLISGAAQQNISDILPMWSPDGQQVAFVRVADHKPDIYLVHAGGSDLHAILNGPEDEMLIGWAPDGRRIFYTVTLADGMSLRVLDLQTGASVEAARLPSQSTQIKLSPDGMRMTYIHENGIYLAALSGGAPVLLVTGSDSIANPIWSPDGRWIALTYLQAYGGSKSSLALLQPETCQFIQLGGQESGWLWSWAP